MPVDTFLQKYLPGFEGRPLELRKDPFEDVPTNGLETDRCDKFITAIAGWIPHLQAVNTSYDAELSGDVNPKPNISIYNRVEGVAPPDQPNFWRMELWIEFKNDTDYNTFRDPQDEENREIFEEKESFMPWLQEDERDRLAHIAACQHCLQLRHFLFSVLVEGDQARFFRWDPSATVVTAAFDYRKNPHLMAEFLWRLDNLSAEKRGHDTSVQPANLSHEVAAHVRKALNMEHSDVPLYRYDMPGTLSGMGYLFGPWLFAKTRSLDAWSSRSSPVVWIPNENTGGDSQTCEESDSSNQRDETVQPGPWSKERLVCLKDTWRYVSDEEVTMAEHEIYDILYRHKTPNIPEDATGGDVVGGRTQTAGLVEPEADWLCVTPSVLQYQHYRLLYGTVGRPLYQFESTKQLVSVIFDALQAHSHAFNNAKLLHRNINTENIIFTDDNQGLLINWDLAIVPGEGSRTSSCRMGTWPFLSANLSMDPYKKNTVTDDLESFLHVLARTMLEYIPARPYYCRWFRDFDSAMFDNPVHDEEDDDEYRGGYQKRDAFRGGYYPSKEFKPQTPTPLTSLLVDLSSPFKSLYAEQPPTAEDRKRVDVTDDCLDQQLSDTLRRYDNDMGCLRSPTWFINTIKDALDKPGWPTGESKNDVESDAD